MHCSSAGIPYTRLERGEGPSWYTARYTISANRYTGGLPFGAPEVYWRYTPSDRRRARSETRFVQGSCGFLGPAAIGEESQESAIRLSTSVSVHRWYTGALPPPILYRSATPNPRGPLPNLY